MSDTYPFAYAALIVNSIGLIALLSNRLTERRTAARRERRSYELRKS